MNSPERVPTTFTLGSALASVAYTIPNFASPRATQQQCRAHVLGLRKFGLDRVPDAELLKRLLAIDAGGAGRDGAHREFAVADCAGKVELMRDRQSGDGIGRLHKHELIAE